MITVQAVDWDEHSFFFMITVQAVDWDEHSFFYFFYEYGSGCGLG